MNDHHNPLTADDLNRYSIQVIEPFSEFLWGTEAEKSFSLSFLDVVRFAGHACFAITGAFLTVRAAVEALYPETKTCVRGQLRVALPGLPNEGASGPIGNVFGFVTGAWAETGFGGLRGEFSRRNLLSYGVRDVPAGAVRFTRTDTGRAVDVFYQPRQAKVELDPGWEFQLQWRHNVKAILDQSDQVIRVIEVGKGRDGE